MTRVFALFDTDDKLQDAQDALNRAGLTEDVERVVDDSAEARGLQTPGVAGVVAPIATDGHLHSHGYAAGAAGLGRNWLSEYEVNDEEAAFLGDAVSGGASLIVVNTERPDEAESILNQAGGSRVFRK